MSVKLVIRHVGDITVIDAFGRLTMGEGADTFRDTIIDLAANGRLKIVQNLGEVSYIDSTGIGELTSAFNYVRNAGGRFAIGTVTKRVDDLLVNLTRLWQRPGGRSGMIVYSNESHAIHDIS